jgi:hypothetical protein
MRASTLSRLVWRRREKVRREDEDRRFRRNSTIIIGLVG